MAWRATVQGLSFVVLEAASGLVYSCCARLGWNGVAKWWYGVAITSMPRFEPTLSAQYAEYLETRGLVAEACALLELCSAKHPTDGFPRAMLGFLLERNGRSADALRALEEAAELRLGVSEGYEQAVGQKIKELRSKLATR